MIWIFPKQMAQVQEASEHILSHEDDDLGRVRSPPLRGQYDSNEE